MKTSLKRILSALLVVVLAAGIFVASPPADAEAASSLKYDKKVTVYLARKTGKSSKYSSDSIKVNTSKSVESVKSSKKSVVGGLLVEPHGSYSLIDFTGKKAGTSTISFKVDSKTYKTKVTVKKYTNPIKTLKVTGVSSGKNIASKVKKTREANVSLKKTKKNAKLTIKTAKNWKITEVYVTDTTTTSAKTKVNKTYKKGISKKKTYKLKTLNKNHSYFISLTLKNKKNGGVQYIYYNINNNYKYY